MTLEVVVYGNGDLFREYFNVIVTSVGTDNFNKMIKLSILLAGITVLSSFILQRDILVIVKWFWMYYIAFFVLFMPKTSVQIIDRVNQGHVYNVANVPFGLAVLASYTSIIGDALTQLTEMNFSMPDDLRYSQTGFVFASRLVTQASQFEITDSEFDKNLQSFINQCVFYDILLNRYTINELVSTNELWNFVSANTSQARAFLYNGVVTVCKAGAEKITKDWAKAIDSAASQYAARIYPSEKDAKRMLLNYLPISYGYLTKVSSTGSDIMKQQLMANAIQRGVIRMDGTLNASAAMESYAFTRAQEQKRLNNLTLGDMAAHWLPLMKNAFELIMYGSFIFIVLLLVFPFGWVILKHYIYSLLWLQVWAPLYAIINLIVSYYAGINSAAAASGALSMRAMSGLAQINSDMAGLAGYLTLSVPFLAYGFARGMAGTFTQLSQYISGVTQSAANMGAQEAVTGNMSLGNTNFGNHSANNTNANHFDTSGSYTSGIFKGQLPGGSSLSSMPDGNRVMNTQNAISNLGTNVQLGESVRTSASKQADSLFTHGQTQSKTYGEQFSAGVRSAAELSKHGSHSESGTAGWNVSTNAATTEAMNAVYTSTAKFAKDNGISFDLAERALTARYAESRVEGHAGVGIPGVAGMSVSGSTGGKLETDKSSSTGEREAYAAAKDYIANSGYAHNMDTVVRAVEERGVRTTNDTGSRILESGSASFDRAETARKEMVHNYQQAQTYREMASYAHDNAWNVNQNLSNPFLKWLASQPGSNPSSPMGMHQAESILLNDPYQASKYAGQFADEYTKSVSTDWEKNNHPRSETAIKNSYDAANMKDRPSIEGNYAKLKNNVLNEAHRDGIAVNMQIDRSPKSDTEKLIADNKKYIADGKTANEMEGKKMKNTVHQAGVKDLK